MEEEIEKEFDKKFNECEYLDESYRVFYPEISGSGTTVYENNREKIKSFIRQVRQNDIKSLIEWVEKMPNQSKPMRFSHISPDSQSTYLWEDGDRIDRTDLLSYLQSLLKRQIKTMKKDEQKVNSPAQPRGWEEKFGQEFFSEKVNFQYGWSQQDSMGFIYVKDFIRQLLNEARGKQEKKFEIERQIHAQCEKQAKDMLDVVRNEAKEEERNELKEKIKKVKKEVEKEIYYNWASSEIVELLESLIDK